MILRVNADIAAASYLMMTQSQLKYNANKLS